MPEVTPVTSTSHLERELTLLARHQLSSNDRVPGLQLDRSAYQLLGRLERGPLSLAGLAKAFKLDVSTVNRQVSALRRDRLVEAIIDPDGGTARLFRPTAEGRRRLTADRRRRQQKIELIIRDWSEDDRQSLTELLTRFNVAIEELEGRPWPRS